MAMKPGVLKRVPCMPAMQHVHVVAIAIRRWLFPLNIVIAK